MEMNGTVTASLLQQAGERLEQSVIMRRCKERLGEALDEIDECLAAAESCVASLLQIKCVCQQVDFSCRDDGIYLGDDVVIPENVLQSEVSEAKKCYVYGITLGYDSREALEHLAYDYIVHQFQHLFSKEVLFIIGRDVFRDITSRESDCVMKRSAVLVKSAQKDEAPCHPDDADAVPVYWSTHYVSNLLQLMPDLREVKVLESGCLSPVYSLMGLMFAYPKKRVN